MSEQPANKAQFNAMRVLSYFATKYAQQYGQAYVPNTGRDITIIKRMKTIFEENGQLADFYLFLDFCFEQNKNKPLSFPYLLKLTNTKFGFVNGKKAKDMDTPPLPPELQEWAEAERKKWNDKLG